MEIVHGKPQNMSQQEILAHKIMLMGRVLREGFDKAIVHVYGEDYKFMKEMEFLNPRKVIDDLTNEMIHS